MKRISCVLSVILVLWCCAGTPREVKVAQKQARVIYEMQKPVVATTSKDDGRPGWTKKSSYSDDANVYFTGGYLNGADYPLTIRSANAEAIKVACQGISQFIRAEFSGYIQGTNQAGDRLDRYVSDGIATFTKALHVQGVRQTDIYYEEGFSPTVARPAYNVWVKLEMSKVDYMHAKAEALKALQAKLDQDGDVEAKEKAQELLDSLKRDYL